MIITCKNCGKYLITYSSSLSDIPSPIDSVICGSCGSIYSFIEVINIYEKILDNTLKILSSYGCPYGFCKECPKVKIGCPLDLNVGEYECWRRFVIFND